MTFRKGKNKQKEARICLLKRDKKDVSGCIDIVVVVTVKISGLVSKVILRINQCDQIWRKFATFATF